ncbi:unnamed protein product [Brugia timori]|uniref:CDK5RAP1 n=1 Tax=Brugia timori TaxID=42155 RepID=A0A0R3R8P4_9BILA|nr:unnamed protein product [Brugia timori]
MSAADGGAAALLIAGLGTGGTDVMYEDDLTDNSIPDIQVNHTLDLLKIDYRSIEQKSGYSFFYSTFPLFINILHSSTCFPFMMPIWFVILHHIL